MWKSIKEYMPTVMHWWWWRVMSSVALGGAIAQYVGYAIPRMPLWAWGMMALVGFSIAQFLAYNKLSNRFTKQVIIPNQIDEVLTRLARLREKGDALRFTGLELKDINEVPQWKGQVMTWRKQVEPEIAKLSPSEATIFRTGGIVDIKLFKKKALNDEHAIFLEAITQDIEKIRKLIERLSTENLARRYRE